MTRTEARGTGLGRRRPDNRFDAFTDITRSAPTALGHNLFSETVMTRTTLLAIAAVCGVAAATPALDLMFTPHAPSGSQARADEAATQAITFEEPWLRLNIAGRPSAGFVSIMNSGETDQLIAARSDAYGRIELHEHSMVDGAMQMRAVEAIAAPGGGMVALAPGGYHLMLFEPTGAVEAGDRAPSTLTFESAGDVVVEFMAQPLGGGAKKKQGGHTH